MENQSEKHTASGGTKEIDWEAEEAGLEKTRKRLRTEDEEYLEEQRQAEENQRALVAGWEEDAREEREEDVAFREATMEVEREVVEMGEELREAAREVEELRALIDELERDLVEMEEVLRWRNPIFGALRPRDLPLPLHPPTEIPFHLIIRAQSLLQIYPAFDIMSAF
ncbi:hypothetical protein HYFRA_00000586 [Hymenoscyphus fraxineus]|uniref:Uncharacterized protein n=1 Tax=Hymenoscyphus fraxineus TaxID=746836 RepID=A0A9N9L640_9HELO|nr:hypothetical protein HYFRA_00000586 [Hymenoscyphus fraxineus]